MFHYILNAYHAAMCRRYLSLYKQHLDSCLELRVHYRMAAERHARCVS
jgi:hypothetical protein